MLSHVLSTWIEMFTKENKLTKSALSKLKIWAGLALLFSWQKQISNLMHGLKSAILVIFQNAWLGWSALLVRPSRIPHMNSKQD